MVYKIFFVCFIFSNLLFSSSQKPGYLVHVNDGFERVDFSFLDRHLSSMRQKYFQNKNLIEDSVVATLCDDTMVVAGLDKVTDHIDDQIRYATRCVDCLSNQDLRFYLEYQRSLLPNHFTKIVQGLQETVPHKFEQSINFKVHLLSQDLESVSQKQKQNALKHAQEQKDLFLYTLGMSGFFATVMLSFSQKKIPIVTQVVGACYIKFLWDQYCRFDAQRSEFWQKDAQSRGTKQRVYEQKAELEVQRSLIPDIAKKLDLYRKDKISDVTTQLEQYHVMQLQRLQREIKEKLEKLPEKEKLARQINLVESEKKERLELLERIRQLFQDITQRDKSIYQAQQRLGDQEKDERSFVAKVFEIFSPFF